MSGADDKQAKSPSEAELEARMRELDRKLGSRREAKTTAGKQSPDNTGFANALRLSTEFVSAVLVGAFIGWGIDRIFGIAPWAMIAFLLLGFVAGVLNLLRAAGQIADPHSAARSAVRGNGTDESPDKVDQ